MPSSPWAATRPVRWCWRSRPCRAATPASPRRATSSSWRTWAVPMARKSTASRCPRGEAAAAQWRRHRHRPVRRALRQGGGAAARRGVAEDVLRGPQHGEGRDAGPVRWRGALPAGDERPARGRAPGGQRRAGVRHRPGRLGGRGVPGRSHLPAAREGAARLVRHARGGPGQPQRHQGQPQAGEPQDAEGRGRAGGGRSPLRLRVPVRGARGAVRGPVGAGGRVHAGRLLELDASAVGRA